MIIIISVETLSEDEDDMMQKTGDCVSISSTYGSSSEFTPTPGGPFSALTPSMWPQDIMVKLGNPVSAFFPSLNFFNPFCTSGISHKV